MVGRGFQFDDHSQTPDRVKVDLYDSHHHIELVFKSKKDAKKEITQADINRAIGRLRAVNLGVSH
jgi:hypothetical protein